MKNSRIKIAMLSTVAIFALGGAVVAQNAAQVPSAATAPASDTIAKTDPDMAKVLATLASLNGKPIESLSPAEARKQPTPTDAVMQIIKDEKRKVDPHAGIKVSNSHFADMGNLRLRYYTPDNATKDSNLPVIAFFRGGG